MPLTPDQVAGRLQVTPERVRQLIADGTLPASRFGRVWMIDETDAERLALLVRPPGRPLSPARAWREIAALEGGSRRPTPDEAVAIAARLRARSENRRIRVHPATLRRMSDDRRLVGGGAVGAVALGAPIAGGGPQDMYVRVDQLAAVLSDYPALDRPVNLVLRSVPAAAWPFQDGQRLVGPVTAILDLLDAADRAAVEALSIWPSP